MATSTATTNAINPPSGGGGVYDGSPTGVDLSAHPAAAELVRRVGEFMGEVQFLCVSSSPFSISAAISSSSSLYRTTLEP